MVEKEKQIFESEIDMFVESFFLKDSEKFLNIPLHNSMKIVKIEMDCF